MLIRPAGLGTSATRRCRFRPAIWDLESGICAATGVPVNAGLGFSVSKQTDHTTVPIISTIITEKITHPCRGRPSIRPYIRTSETETASSPHTKASLSARWGFRRGGPSSCRKAAAVGAQLLHGNERG